MADNIPDNGVNVVVEHVDYWTRTTKRVIACRFSNKWWDVAKTEPLRETSQQRVTRYWQLSDEAAITI